MRIIGQQKLMNLLFIVSEMKWSIQTACLRWSLTRTVFEVFWINTKWYPEVMKKEYGHCQEWDRNTAPPIKEEELG